MVREEEKSRWWWFESHKNSMHSQWLQSTLAELDAKTKAMLKLIEGNADSFAQRAETYYKKRPELISIVEDFYRAHRSLAERFDHHLKSSSENGSRSSSDKFHQQETNESVCDSSSHTNSEFEDAGSEIEDPEEEEEDEETSKLERERLKLIEQSHALKKQLLEKDEEKREVIRQLALTVEALKDENFMLKRRLSHDETSKKRSVFEFNLIGKLFYVMCDGKKIV